MKGRCRSAPVPSARFCSLWGMLSGGVLAGCGVSGPPTGGPLPQVTDLHGVTLTGSTVLAAPAGWTPAPTVTTPVFAVGAPQLFAAMKEIMLGEPRTWLTVSYPQGEAFFIVRSMVLNLPDIVVVQAIAVTDQHQPGGDPLAEPLRRPADQFSRRRQERSPGAASGRRSDISLRNGAGARVEAVTGIAC